MKKYQNSRTFSLTNFLLLLQSCFTCSWNFCHPQNLLSVYVGSLDRVVVERVCAELAAIGQDVVSGTVGAALPRRQARGHHV
jgi:hypothetical protein